MKASELLSNEYGNYYKTYIEKAGDLALIDSLKASFIDTLDFYRSIPENKLEYAYGEGKWTIKELIQHLIDAERVFTYRALRFARYDKHSLPGYEHNDYAVLSKANRRTREDLMAEYRHVRESTLSLFSSFTEDMLMQIGEASGNPMSVRAIGFICVGHEAHHCDIIRERYL